MCDRNGLDQFRRAIAFYVSSKAVAGSFGSDEPPLVGQITGMKTNFLRDGLMYTTANIFWTGILNSFFAAKLS